MYKNKAEKLILVLICIWMVVLVGRFAVYVSRIYKEFTQPVELYLEHVNPCDGGFSLIGADEQKLYEYRKLGVECQN